MERHTELLYWTQFKQFIHYDKSKKEYSFDPQLPERAKKSFLDWLEQR